MTAMEIAVVVMAITTRTVLVIIIDSKRWLGRDPVVVANPMISIHKHGRIGTVESSM